jgi:hypothetical protein
VIAVLGVALAGAAGRPAFGEGIGLWHAAGAPLGSDFGPAVTLADGRVLALSIDTEYEYSEYFAPGERAVEGEHRHLASELYEPSSRTWIPGPSPPGEGASNAIALPGGGALLLGQTICERTAPSGARAPAGEPERICRPSVAAYRLNATETQWTPVPMLVARTRPAVVRLNDGGILVAGGFGAACSPTVAFGYSCPALPSAEVFNPAAGTWTATPPMSSPRGGAAATLLSDGTVLLVGGEPSTEYVLRYNPTSKRWSTLPAPPFPLTGTTLLPLPGDRAIALGFDGGADFEGSYGGAGIRARRICRSIPEIYDAAHNTWMPAPPLPGKSPYSCSTEAVAIAGGQILLDDASVLDARQGCWSPVAKPRRLAVAATIPLLTGEALAFGVEGPTTDAETYMPGTATCSAAQETRSSLFEYIAPQGASASAASLLAHGYSFSLQIAAPGEIQVIWYSTVETNEGSMRVLLAHGHARSSAKRPVTITVRLTAKGHEVLAAEMGVTAQGTFTARGRGPVTATRPFTLQDASPRH